MMAEQTLPIHTKSNAVIPPTLSAHFAFSKEISLWRPQQVLHRNLRAFFWHHIRACNQQSAPANAIISNCQQQTTTRITADSRTSPDGSVAVSEDHDTSKPLIDAVSRDTLLVKTMDPDFEPSRRSTRHLMQNIFDDDEAELVLAPIAIRKKINFAHNRPDEADRPRKKFQTDRSVQRIRCHCTLTIWDNRNGLEETAASLVEKHIRCMVTWLRTERTGHVVDIEPDKPFKIKASDLKVPKYRNGEWELAISDNYFMEMKMCPTKSGCAWPPIPLLGKSDGDINRPNRAAHTLLSDSLVAKFNNLPNAPGQNTALSIFYLDESGAMLRTKYGLEVSGEWHASKVKLSESPGPRNNEIAWAVDDSNQFLGRKKRPRAESSPKIPPRRRKISHQSPKPHKPAIVEYLWEATQSVVHSAQDRYQTTEFEGLGCPACPTYDAQDLWELRFHFLSAHARFNFALNSEEYNHDTGELVAAFFRVSSVQPSKRRAAQESEKEFLFLAKSAPFDLTAYLNGDTSWTGERSSQTVQKPRPRTNVRVDSARGTTPSTKIPGFVTDPLLAIRVLHNGHLPPEHVPDFRRVNRQKHKNVPLVRLTDTKTQSYDSISHRQTDLSEESMSETDDERDDEWYIQRHLENLAVSGQESQRNDMKQELFRRWDRHRLEEKLDHVAFISESLIRFVKRNRRWLKNGNASLLQAFGSFTHDLLGDRLIDAEIERHVRFIIWRNPDDTNTDIISPKSIMNNTRSTSQPTAPNTSGTQQTPTPPSPHIVHPPTTPLQALEKWRAHLLTLPPNYCGVCADPLMNPADTSLLCSARKCKTPDVRFHFNCVRVKKGTGGAGDGDVANGIKAEKSLGDAGSRKWVCMACRLEMKEDAREAKGAPGDVGGGGGEVMDVDSDEEELVRDEKRTFTGTLKGTSKGTPKGTTKGTPKGKGKQRAWGS